MSTIEKVAEIIHSVFEDETTAIERQTTAHDVEGWDSLSHVNLIVAIESTFGIKFLQKELLTFKNVGDMVDAIDAKMAPR